MDDALYFRGRTNSAATERVQQILLTLKRNRLGLPGATTATVTTSSSSSSSSSVTETNSQSSLRASFDLDDELDWPSPKQENTDPATVLRQAAKMMETNISRFPDAKRTTTPKPTSFNRPVVRRGGRSRRECSPDMSTIPAGTAFPQSLHHIQKYPEAYIRQPKLMTTLLRMTANAPKPDELAGTKENNTVYADRENKNTKLRTRRGGNRESRRRAARVERDNRQRSARKRPDIIDIVLNGDGNGYLKPCSPTVDQPSSAVSTVDESVPDSPLTSETGSVVASPIDIKIAIPLSMDLDHNPSESLDSKISTWSSLSCQLTMKLDKEARALHISGPYPLIHFAEHFIRQQVRSLDGDRKCEQEMRNFFWELEPDEEIPERLAPMHQLGYRFAVEGEAGIRFVLADKCYKEERVSEGPTVRQPYQLSLLKVETPEKSHQGKTGDALVSPPRAHFYTPTEYASMYNNLLEGCGVAICTLRLSDEFCQTRVELTFEFGRVHFYSTADVQNPPSGDSPLADKHGMLALSGTDSNASRRMPPVYVQNDRCKEKPHQYPCVEAEFVEGLPFVTFPIRRRILKIVDAETNFFRVRQTWSLRCRLFCQEIGTVHLTFTMGGGFNKDGSTSEPTPPLKVQKEIVDYAAVMERMTTRKFRLLKLESVSRKPIILTSVPVVNPVCKPRQDSALGGEGVRLDGEKNISTNLDYRHSIRLCKSVPNDVFEDVKKFVRGWIWTEEDGILDLLQTEHTPPRHSKQRSRPVTNDTQNAYPWIFVQAPDESSFETINSIEYIVVPPHLPSSGPLRVNLDTQCAYQLPTESLIAAASESSASGLPFSVHHLDAFPLSQYRARTSALVSGVTWTWTKEMDQKSEGGPDPEDALKALRGTEWICEMVSSEK